MTASPVFGGCQDPRRFNVDLDVLSDRFPSCIFSCLQQNDAYSACSLETFSRL